MDLLEIREVTKSYGSKMAVAGISLNIPVGIVYGLLGPNGAGKTSLIRMITRITYPDSGSILYQGTPLADRHQELIGYMPEERGLYRKMKVGEQIIYLLQLKGMTGKRAKEVAEAWIERFELTKWKNNKVQELSKGMQQKVQFIATIAHEPPLLILDEPFSGLDPINSQLIEEVIREFKAKGTTVIFSTHRMEQVEEFCDHIALINNGRIIVEENIRSLRKKYRKNRYTFEMAETLQDQPELPFEVTLLHQDAHHFQVSLNEGYDVRRLLTFMNDRYDILKFEQYIPGLREIFIELVESSKNNVHE